MWSNSKTRMILSIAVVLILIAGFSLWKRTPREISAEPADAKNLTIGDMFPTTVEMVDSSGKIVHGSDFQKHALLINFWAAWCGPCMQEMPSLVALQKTYAGRDLEVLAFDMDDSTSEGEKKLRARIGDHPLKIFRGIDSPVFRLFDVSGVPFSVLVDKAGKIRFAEAGEADWMSPAMRLRVEAAL